MLSRQHDFGPLDFTTSQIQSYISAHPEQDLQHLQKLSTLHCRSFLLSLGISSSPPRATSALFSNFTFISQHYGLGAEFLAQKFRVSTQTMRDFLRVNDLIS